MEKDQLLNVNVEHIIDNSEIAYHSAEFILKEGLEKRRLRKRPYVCPVPGCKKAYKQRNGILYHAHNGHRRRQRLECCGKKAYSTQKRLLSSNRETSRHLKATSKPEQMELENEETVSTSVKTVDSTLLNEKDLYQNGTNGKKDCEEGLDSFIEKSEWAKDVDKISADEDLSMEILDSLENKQTDLGEMENSEFIGHDSPMSPFSPRDSSGISVIELSSDTSNSSVELVTECLEDKKSTSTSSTETLVDYSTKTFERCSNKSSSASPKEFDSEVAIVCGLCYELLTTTNEYEHHMKVIHPAGENKMKEFERWINEIMDPYS